MFYSQLIYLERSIYHIHSEMYPSHTILDLFPPFGSNIQTGWWNWLWSVYCVYFRALLIPLIPLDEFSCSRTFFFPFFYPFVAPLLKWSPGNLPAPPWEPGPEWETRQMRSALWRVRCCTWWWWRPNVKWFTCWSLGRFRGPDNLWTRRPARRSEASGREGGRLEVRGRSLRQSVKCALYQHTHTLTHTSHVTDSNSWASVWPIHSTGPDIRTLYAPLLPHQRTKFH